MTEIRLFDPEGGMLAAVTNQAVPVMINKTFNTWSNVVNKKVKGEPLY